MNDNAISPWKWDPLLVSSMTFHLSNALPWWRRLSSWRRVKKRLCGPSSRLQRSNPISNPMDSPKREFREVPEEAGWALPASWSKTTSHPPSRRTNGLNCSTEAEKPPISCKTSKHAGLSYRQKGFSWKPLWSNFWYSSRFPAFHNSYKKRRLLGVYSWGKLLIGNVFLRNIATTDGR